VPVSKHTKDRVDSGGHVVYILYMYNMGTIDVCTFVNTFTVHRV